MGRGAKRGINGECGVVEAEVELPRLQLNGGAGTGRKV